MHSCEFVLSTTFWVKTLQAINDVSVLLQGAQVTLDEEVRLIVALVKDLQLIESFLFYMDGIACHLLIVRHLTEKVDSLQTKIGVTVNK